MCEALLQRELGGDALATRSQAYYLDVTNPARPQGRGGARACPGPSNIPVVDIMTIGDGTNDIPMLQAAGFSVAMGNGSDAVKAAAQAVTDDCENDGFAKAIERYVLGSCRARLEPRSAGGRDLSTPASAPNPSAP